MYLPQHILMNSYREFEPKNLTPLPFPDLLDTPWNDGAPLPEMFAEV